MAATNLNAGLAVTRWLKEFYTEFTRQSPYSPWTGNSSKSVIYLNYELGKNAGDRIRIPVSRKLAGGVVTDDNTLEGNETAFVSLYDEVVIGIRRKATKISKNSTFKTDLDMLGSIREGLVDHASSTFDADLNTALGSVIVKGASDDVADTAVPFASANTSQKNAFNTANADRILNVAGAGAKFTPSVLADAKSKARATATGSAGFAIKPLKSDAGNSVDTYVIFAGQKRFEEFAADADVAAVNANARPRAVESNPLFTGEDQYLNGVIVHYVPGLPDDEIYLCGQGAVTVAWGQKTQMIKDSFDYGMFTGIGYEETRGIKKLSVQGVQVAVVTIRFTPAA